MSLIVVVQSCLSVPALASDVGPIPQEPARTDSFNRSETKPGVESCLPGLQQPCVACSELDLKHAPICGTPRCPEKWTYRWLLVDLPLDFLLEAIGETRGTM